MNNKIEDLIYPEYSEYSECDDRPMSVCSGVETNAYEKDWFTDSSDSMDSEVSLKLPIEGDEQSTCIDELITLAVNFYQSKYNLEEHKLADHEDSFDRRIQQISSELQYAYNMSYFRYIEYYCAYDRLFINTLFSDAEVRDEGMRLIHDAPAGCDVDAFRTNMYVLFQVPEVSTEEVPREYICQTPPPVEEGPSLHVKSSIFNSPTSVFTLIEEDPNRIYTNGAM